MNPIRPLLASLLAIPCLARPTPAQTHFDLIAYQTPLKNQGGRGTCIAFAATAALEARYRHATPPLTLDLSEEFVNYVGKMMWLHPYWSAITTADTRENQLGFTDGGGGTGHAHDFVHWMKVPVESAMPYVASYPPTLPAWTDPFWDSQRNTNEFNLDHWLPRTALTQNAYYAATGVTDLANPNDTTAIETALRGGYEVVWDFDVRGDRSAAIWHASSAPSIGGHSMLIIGYDRTDPNPANHYFIVKNSWGPTANAGGFTWIGYDYVAAGYASAACYLTGAATPAPWPMYQWLGRRNLSFDGFHGTLDVYHLPGASTEIWSRNYSVTIPDHRIGTFYDSSGTAYRVNGVINGNQLMFWFKGLNPNMRWDETRETPTLGRMFLYALTDHDGTDIAGWHWDNAGMTPLPAYGGYARVPYTIHGTDGFLHPVFANSQPWAPEQFLGRWGFEYSNTPYRVELVVQRRDDSRVPLAHRGLYAGLVCTWLNLAGRYEFIAEVPLADPATIQFSSPVSPDSFDLRMLSWERGVFAGQAVVNGMHDTAGFAWREGSFLLGSTTPYGVACGTPGRLLNLDIHGDTLAAWMDYYVAGAPPNGLAIVAIGLSNTSANGTPLPFNLGTIGAPGCHVYADPFFTAFVPLTSIGTGTYAAYFTPAALLGQHLYSQCFALDPTANALGITASNGVDTMLGGWQ